MSTFNDMDAPSTAGAPLEPQPYPGRDPWNGTDEADDDEPTMGPGDYCHHGVPFDEDCYWCDDEGEDDE